MSTVAAPIEIFRPGTFTPMVGEPLTFSEADRAACAAAYDPALHEAPLCGGHPSHNLPAYDWVKSLRFARSEAGGVLVVDPDRSIRPLPTWCVKGASRRSAPLFSSPTVPVTRPPTPPAPLPTLSKEVIPDMPTDDVKKREAVLEAREADFAERDRAARWRDNAAFATPAGDVVDPAGAVLHGKALAHQAKNPGVGYLEAVKAVGGQARSAPGDAASIVDTLRSYLGGLA